MNDLGPFDVALYPIELPQERLAHRDSDFASGSYPREADRDDSPAHRISLPKLPLRFLPYEDAVLFIKGDVVIHDL